MSSDHPHAEHAADHPVPHAVPIKVLAGVFALLMGFTVLTVAATWVDLGEFNIVVALGIALVKAVLVCLYFMHLRYDSPFYSVVLGTALLFVVLFIAVALIDSREYAPLIEAASEARAAPGQ